MTNQSAGAVDAVREARGHLDLDAQAYAIKRAVADQVVQLDPGVKVEFTNYFNHSYVPDFVATWREGGRKLERRVFIRGSMKSVIAADDLEALADQDPLVLGLAEESKKTWARVRAHVPKASKVLATDLSATTDMAGRSEATSSNGESSELPDLVRANLIRGGRGVLDPAAARRVLEVDSTDDPVSALLRFEKTVKSLFVGQTAERISRTAELLKVFFEASPNRAVLQGLRDEPLNDAELQVVLPFVLHRAARVQDETVWELLASMLTLPRIEAMSVALDGFDLTKLVRLASSSMVVARSAIFVNANEVTDEEKDATAPTWRIKGGRLAADIRRWTLWVASDSRRIKGRDDGPDARWDELSSPLRDFQMTGIELRGLSRQLSVENTQARTVREDVERIRTTIDDDFHVSAVRLNDGSDDDSPSVRVEFESSTVTGSARLSFHARAASLLAVKAPVVTADLLTLVV